MTQAGVGAYSTIGIVDVVCVPRDSDGLGAVRERQHILGWDGRSRAVAQGSVVAGVEGLGTIVAGAAVGHRIGVAGDGDHVGARRPHGRRSSCGGGGGGGGGGVCRCCGGNSDSR